MLFSIFSHTIMSNVTNKCILCASVVIVVFQFVQCQRSNRHDRQDFGFQTKNIFSTSVSSNGGPNTRGSSSTSLPMKVDSSSGKSDKIKRLTWLKNQITHCALLGSNLKFLKKVEDIGDDYDTIRFKVPEQILQEYDGEHYASAAKNSNDGDADSTEEFDTIEPEIELTKTLPHQKSNKIGPHTPTPTSVPNHRPFLGPILYHGQLNPRPKKPWTNPLSWSSNSYSKPVELVESEPGFVPIVPPNYNMIKKLSSRIDGIHNITKSDNRKADGHPQSDFNKVPSLPDVHPVFTYIESLPTFTTESPQSDHYSEPYFHTQYRRVIVKNTGTENNHINSNIQHISKKKRPYTIYMTTDRIGTARKSDTYSSRREHVERVTPSSLWEVFPLEVPGIEVKNESRRFDHNRYNRVKTYDMVSTSNRFGNMKKVSDGVEIVNPRIMPKNSFPTTFDLFQENHGPENKTATKGSDEVIFTYRDPAHYMDNAKETNTKPPTSLPLVITKNNIGQFNRNQSNIFYGLADQRDKFKNHRKKSYMRGRSLLFRSSPASVNDTTEFLTSGKVTKSRFILSPSESIPDIVTSKYPLEYLSSGSVLEESKPNQLKRNQSKQIPFKHDQSKLDEIQSKGSSKTYELRHNSQTDNRLSRSQIFLKLNTSMSVGTSAILVSDDGTSKESDSEFDIITSKYPFEYLSTGNIQVKAISPITTKLNVTLQSDLSKSNGSNNTSKRRKEQNLESTFTNVNQLDLDTVENHITNNRVDRSPKLNNRSEYNSKLPFLFNKTLNPSKDNKSYNYNATSTFPKAFIAVEQSRHDRRTKYLPLSMNKLVDHIPLSRMDKKGYSTSVSNKSDLGLRSTVGRGSLKLPVTRRHLNLDQMLHNDVPKRSSRARGRSYDKLWKYELLNLSRNPKIFNIYRSGVEITHAGDIGRYRGTGRNRFNPPAITKQNENGKFLKRRGYSGDNSNTGNIRC